MRLFRESLKKTAKAFAKSKEQSGQTLILAALFFSVLAGAAALTIDAGLVYIERRSTQNASDAAALAAANALLDGSTVASAESIGEQWAAKNGYNASVEIHIPPTTGPHAGDSDFVEVFVSGTSEATFAKVLGKTAWDVSSRAVAGRHTVQRPYAIMVMNKTACHSMVLNGTVNIDIDGSGMFVNSSCAQAIYAEGTVDVNTDVNDQVGGYQFQGPVTFNPMPTNVGHVEDPLGGVPEPNPPSGPVQNCAVPGGPGTHTFQPGVYSCALNLSGNKTFNFAPGDYLIEGGLSVSGITRVNFGTGIYTFRGQGLKLTGSGQITSDHAMFFVEEGDTDLSGTGDMDLTAPVTGIYAGIAIFQARDNPNQLNARGTALSQGKGTIYAIAAKISLVGTADTNNFQLISDTFIMSGVSGVDIDWEDNFLADVPFSRLFE